MTRRGLFSMLVGLPLVGHLWKEKAAALEPGVWYYPCPGCVKTQVEPPEGLNSRNALCSECKKHRFV